MNPAVMRFKTSIALLLAVISSTLPTRHITAGEEAEQDAADVSPTATIDEAAVGINRVRLPELLAIEQLVLVLSNANSASGDRQEVLVFLGRSNQRGWEAIGIDDLEELRSHWRSVASRILAESLPPGLEDQRREKIDLAVELSITQFLRLYTDLRSEFLSQTDQRSRLAVLANDDRYDRLRQIGREGLFTADSLLAKVIEGLTEDNKDTSH
jgi:hypothetical protein